MPKSTGHPPRSAAPSVQDTSVLRKLREKHGLSQRVLAEKSGISRGRLRRLEGREFDHITYRELKRISETLGVEMGEIFLGVETSSDGFHLGRKGESAFQWEGANAGYKIISLLPARGDLFVGKLFVFAKKRIPPAHAPRARRVFIEMILGKLRVEGRGESYEIAEGDHLLFPGDTPYSIENLLLRDAVALLLTLPAFRS